MISRLWPCMVESDAQVVVNLINATSAPFSDVGLFICDNIKLLEAHPTFFFVSFTHRKANTAAHHLAKLCLSLDSDMFWMEEVPPCVVLAMVGDCPKYKIHNIKTHHKSKPKKKKCSAEEEEEEEEEEDGDQLKKIGGGEGEAELIDDGEGEAELISDEQELISGGGERRRKKENEDEKRENDEEKR
ncbi:hypothetical protein Ddye_001374 [Dipteronia dyeriana]|uniref:RNase H type-1 domain-containing protein n=1 Tax=Dipteronia dyeriana TaxID=168575 RepID=A0AAE0CTB1_9ROSI|nr:hypothetical protein Ddye_001374 [Dipteronia dyeriana]